MSDQKLLPMLEQHVSRNMGLQGQQQQQQRLNARLPQ